MSGMVIVQPCKTPREGVVDGSGVFRHLKKILFAQHLMNHRDRN
jgi:hypothetical protein